MKAVRLAVVFLILFPAAAMLSRETEGFTTGSLQAAVISLVGWHRGPI